MPDDTTVLLAIIVAGMLCIPVLFVLGLRAEKERERAAAEYLRQKRQ
jgi:hypothetical protein